MITGGIGLVRLHHSIVGTAEVLGALFVSDQVTWLAFGHFLLWATLGIALGGSVFMALLRYSFVERGAPPELLRKPLFLRVGLSKRGAHGV